MQALNLNVLYIFGSLVICSLRVQWNGCSLLQMTRPRWCLWSAHKFCHLSAISSWHFILPVIVISYYSFVLWMMHIA